ncbi:hypothetical protein RHOSPDRAFT_34497 [Rhodotorula sp. JG-1b]|nr:hypothetical protein RHOSPDRAFT_34497 [Rhodotorula sp. JG-1b]
MEKPPRGFQASDFASQESITTEDPPAGHPRGKLDRQLALSRVHRLLRPLRTAVHHLTAQLDSDAAPIASKSRPLSRRSWVDEDGDWSASSSSNNNTRSGSTSKRRRTSGAAQTRARGGGKGVSDAGASSPFGPGWRRTLGRTTKKYGSRKTVAATAASGLDPASTATASTAAYEDDLVTVDDLIARLRRNSNTCVSVLLIQRAEQLLRAYANILDAVYAVGSSSSHTCEPTDKGKGRERVPTLVELSARQVGASVEENVRACLDLDHPSEGSESERETVTVEIRSTTSRGMERSASAQEAQLEASRVQDEWYEACPASTWRWILAEHATAIVVDASHVRMPFPVLDACYQLCLMYRAEQEASRFYLPLIETALYGSSGHILPLLRSSPSPRHLVDAALLPTLLDSAFADRLFYKAFLSLTSFPVGSRLRSGEDVSTTAVLLAGLMHVARHMLAAISSTARAEDLDPDSVGRMVDEVCRRVATQLRAAVPLWMTACGGMGDQALESLRSEFAALDAAFAELDTVSGAMREVLELDIVVELGLAPLSLDDRLEALSHRLASLAQSDSSSSSDIDSDPDSDSDSDSDASDSTSLRSDSSTLTDTLARFLCPHRSLADVFQLCDQLEARYGTRTVGRDLVAVLLRATLAAQGSQPTVREQVERRLGARSRSAALGKVERRMARSATPADPEPDSTDYDEQPVLSQRRRPRPGGKRTRRWALSESPSEDRRSSSVEVVESRRLALLAATAATQGPSTLVVFRWTAESVAAFTICTPAVHQSRSFVRPEAGSRCETEAAVGFASGRFGRAQGFKGRFGGQGANGWLSEGGPGKAVLGRH